MQRRRLPQELIELVLVAHVEADEHLSLPTSALLPVLSPVFLSSKFLYFATLKALMRDLRIQLSVQLHKIVYMLQSPPVIATSCLHWVKELSVPSWSLFLHSSLSLLTHLAHLTITCEAEVFTSQHRSLSAAIFSQSFLQLSTSIRSLTLVSLPVINATLLQAISSAFPLLLDLKLDVIYSRFESLLYDAQVQDSCTCFLCIEEELECMIHSPVPYYYSDIFHMSESLAVGLKPLKTLTNLHLGIILSDEHILSHHINICSKPEADDDECKCHLAEKTVQDREIQTTQILASTLKALRTISFCSLFHHGGAEVLGIGRNYYTVERQIKTNMGQLLQQRSGSFVAVRSHHHSQNKV